MALLRPDDFFLLRFQRYRRCFRCQLAFHTVLKISPAVTGTIASIACALDHCRVAGRSGIRTLCYPPKTVQIGLGLHNEHVSNSSDCVRYEI